VCIVACEGTVGVAETEVDFVNIDAVVTNLVVVVVDVVYTDYILRSIRAMEMCCILRRIRWILRTMLPTIHTTTLLHRH